MPKKRRSTGSRSCKKRIYIVCEGSDGKSEYAYFKGLLEDCRFTNDIEIKSTPTKKNSGKELVRFASQLIEKEYKSIDEAWVVYDKDGYTKHSETFSEARTKKVNIAFSSISFETWILLHFEYTSRAFNNSDEIISCMKHKHKFIYEKKDNEIYSKIKNKTCNAISNSKKLAHYERTGSGGKPIYELNPYTDVYKLVELILTYKQKV